MHLVCFPKLTFTLGIIVIPRSIDRNYYANEAFFYAIIVGFNANEIHLRVFGGMSGEIFATSLFSSDGVI